ncbi:unnamed protein product [Psylliodes chrysocephalus]|uniref:Uncharacterized protein n=1 Tax=Psylliodes chrysocephalus TaxID=3402493 RepID=A0A9P0CPT2_9CUCU|nr:unnamed protein product [Psylliodes chrysocephala]
MTTEKAPQYYSCTTLLSRPSQQRRLQNSTEAVTDNTSVLISEDPGLWPRSITNDEVRILVERVPPLVGNNYQFPANKDKDERTFLSKDDNVFEEKLAQAGELAAALEIKQGFSPLNTVRRKYKPKLFDYEQRDETPQDPKTAFKINFFLKIIDQTLSSLNSRFEMISDYDNVFGLFSDIFKLNDEDLLKCCRAL